MPRIIRDQEGPDHQAGLLAEKERRLYELREKDMQEEDFDCPTTPRKARRDKMFSNHTFKLELNIAYCTFGLKEINAFVQLFEGEKRKVAQEIKELYEQASMEIEEGEIQDNATQWKRELVNRLKALEKNDKHKGESIDIFEKQVKLTFKIKAGIKTYAGDNWLDILSKANEPIHIIIVNLECPDIKKRIYLEIREVKNNANFYRNKYIISGLDQDWVNKTSDIFNEIIVNCKNNRKQWFDMLSLLEPLFGLLITGSIFLLLIKPLLVTQIEPFHQELDTIKFLLEIIVFSVVWILFGAGITRMLINSIRNQYPTIEISINNFERANKRTRFLYIIPLIILPYILNYIIFH